MFEVARCRAKQGRGKDAIRSKYVAMYRIIVNSEV